MSTNTINEEIKILSANYLDLSKKNFLLIEENRQLRKQLAEYEKSSDFFTEKFAEMQEIIKRHQDFLYGNV